MNIVDTKLQLKEFRKYGNVKLKSALEEIYPGESDHVMLFDKGKEGYGLMVTVLEYNYPSAPNYDEDYFYNIDSSDLSVSFEYDASLYKGVLADLDSIKRVVIDLITVADKLFQSKLFQSRNFDCIILTRRSSNQLIGVAENTGYSLYDVDETVKCKNVLYLTT